MKNQKTIQKLQLKKTVISHYNIVGGLPIQNKITRETCDVKSLPTNCRRNR
ncbi:MAG: hypothetical protein AAF617_03245 [Bacteroidota bacterium]